jgi:hypothetical protein
MYAAFRHYKFDPKLGPEIDRKTREIFVPLIKKIPGFVAYYWVDTGVGEGASISVFKNKQGADESVRVAAQHVHQNVPAPIKPPVVVEGPVKAHG